MRRKGYEELTWFTFSYSPVRDESGRVAGIYCACTETTKQVLADRDRIQEYERLHQLFEQSPGIMAVLREPGHIFELANAAHLQLVGDRELIGKTVREAFPELEGQGFYELLDGVFATGKPFVGRAVSVKLQRRPSAALEERFVDFVYQPIKDLAGSVTGIFIEGSDVTEVVRASVAQRESELRLRQLANTIPQLAWMANADGWIHWYNDRWYEYTGTTLQQMEGWGWLNVHDPEKLPSVLEEWQASIATGTPFEMAFPLRAANGEYRTFFTRVAPLHDATGKIVQWFGTNTDVTLLENAKNELRMANRRKDEFLAMLAHELRNPLAPISNAAQLLKFGRLDEKRVRQTSNIIARQVDHMTKLVDDLLDVSRVTRGLIALHKETLDINSILADSVEQVHSLVELKRQHLIVEAPNELHFLEGDRTRLIQIFTNSVNNAAKYTQENGHITVRLDLQQDQVEFSVRDDGIGIASELLPHVFELFTQAERSPDRSQGGLGLGLALVKSLVELYDGSVSAQSEGIGKGSEFIVRLPRLLEAAQEQEHQDNDVNTQHSSDVLRLMVVDDNADAAQILSMLLETVGHEVTVEYSAQGALERARHQAPQMLFLDIGLPDMDGYELARQLRAMPETAQSVFVAVTGYDQLQDQEHSKAAGFDHHLVKPVKVTAILGLLADLQRSRLQ